MKLPEEVRVSMYAFILAVIFLLGMAGENIYLAQINRAQQHTIRQFMGLEDGPEATPRPLKKPKLPYVPPLGTRTI